MTAAPHHAGPSFGSMVMNSPYWVNPKIWLFQNATPQMSENPVLVPIAVAGRDEVPARRVQGVPRQACSAPSMVQPHAPSAWRSQVASW